MKASSWLVALLVALGAAPAFAQGMCCAWSGDGVGGSTCCPPGACCGGGSGCGACRPEPEPEPEPYGACPEGAPVSCGGGKCCSNSTPVCCANKNLCGTSQAACEGKKCDDPSATDCGNGCCGAGMVCAGNGCCPKDKPINAGSGKCCPASAPYYCAATGNCTNGAQNCKSSCPNGYQEASGYNGGNKRCCPAGFSYACNDGSCDVSPNCHGTGLDGYKKPTTNNTTGAGGGGGPCGPATGNCSNLGAMFHPAKLRSGCCTSTTCSKGGTIENCADSCNNGWYEARGTLYGPCNVQNTSCMQNAAAGAVNACK